MKSLIYVSSFGWGSLWKIACSLTMIILMLSGCFGITNQQSSSLNEECLVIETVINALYEDEIISIMEKTVPSDFKASTEKEFIQENLGALIEEDTFENYQTNNRKVHDFDPNNCLNIRYVRLSDDERKQIFEQGEGWTQFQSQYPEASKVLTTFSKVGFNSDMSQALVYVQMFGDYGAGDGLYVFLIKTNGVWSIQRKIIAWVA